MRSCTRTSLEALSPSHGTSDTPQPCPFRRTLMVERTIALRRKLRSRNLQCAWSKLHLLRPRKGSPRWRKKCCSGIFDWISPEKETTVSQQ